MPPNKDPVRDQASVDLDFSSFARLKQKNAVVPFLSFHPSPHPPFLHRAMMQVHIARVAEETDRKGPTDRPRPMRWVPMLNGFPSPCRGAGCEALEELPEKTEILESGKRRRSKGGETAHHRPARRRIGISVPAAQVNWAIFFSKLKEKGALQIKG